MDNGWIKIHRKILDWEWFDDDNTFRCFMYLLFRANYEEKRWHGIVIKRGQLVTSLCSLSKDLHMSYRAIRTCLNRLVEGQTIDKQTTNKYTLITICKYDTYQAVEEPKRQANDKQTTNKRQTNDKQTTTTKEYKNNIYKETTNTSVLVAKKAELSLTNAQKSLYESLVPFVKVYGKEMIRAFYNYWSEPNKSKTKTRQQLERTWDVSRRLATWASRENKYGNEKFRGNNGGGSGATDEDVLATVNKLLAEDGAK